MKAITLFALMVTIPFAAERYSDVPYYPVGTAPNPDKNVLDIYVPDSAESNIPVFFWIHGGGWTFGDKEQYITLGENMADEEGFVAVIISYRLSDSLHPDVVHPDHITDVARAFAWTKANISDYSGDPDRIFICGQSAGGHLCALLFTNTAYIEAEGLSCNDICGAMPISIGVYDMWTYVVGDTLPSVFYQPAFGNDSAIWYDASPKYFLHDDMPPTRIFAAQDDPISILLETANFYNDMNLYRDTDTIIVDGGHISEVWDLQYNYDSRIRRQIVAFMEEIISSVSEISKKPSSFAIFAHPNPFNSSVAISVGQTFLSGKADERAGMPVLPCEVEIYDLRGNVVYARSIPRSLSSQGEGDNSQAEIVSEGQSPSPSGEGLREEFIWTPDESIPSGIYLVKAKTEADGTITKRIVYLK